MHYRLVYKAVCAFLLMAANVQNVAAFGLNKYSVSRTARLAVAPRARPRLVGRCRASRDHSVAHRLLTQLDMMSDDDREAGGEDVESGDKEMSMDESLSVDDGEKKGFWSKIFGTKKIDRTTLTKLGTSVILSYGFVSNAFGCTAVSCAWYIASRRSGLSPLAPEQWKGFLAVYAGFFAFLNIIRPARFALSVYLSRYFEKAVVDAQSRFNCNKATAIGLVVFFVNICGSLALITIGIATASALSGVPVWTTT